MTETPRIAVVGGGIAGLSAAYALQRAEVHAEVVLVESGDLGGKIRTDAERGFVIEAGPDSFLSSKPAGLELCQSLGLEGELQGAEERNRGAYVMRDGRLQAMPAGLTGLVPSRLEPLLASDLFSPEGKARMAMEPEIPAGRPGADETIASFMIRRFGEEVYDRLIEPLMAGIYAGDGTRLSLEATFPHLRHLEEEYGSVLAGIQAAGRPTIGSDGRGRLPPFLTPRSGMGRIVGSLRRSLKGIRLLESTPVSALRRTARGYEVLLGTGDALQADSVVVATPAYAASGMLEPVDPDLAALLAGIRYVSTATVSVGYGPGDVAHPLDGHGYVVPRREQRPVLACTWTSRKFAHRAPPGHTLLRAFIGRDGMEEALNGTDGELLALVRDELREVLGITAPPLLSRIYRWPRSMPQYAPGHLQRLAGIEERLAHHPGLFVAGSAYRGVGIPDCIRTGEIAAASVVARLQDTRTRSTA